MCRQVLEQGEPIVNVEIEGVAPRTGERRCWLSSYYPVRIEDEMIGVGIVVVDITERKEAEEFRAVVMDNMAEGCHARRRRAAHLHERCGASRCSAGPRRSCAGRRCTRRCTSSAPTDAVPRRGVRLRQVHTTGMPVRTRRRLHAQGRTIIPVAYSAAPLRTGRRSRARSSSSVTSPSEKAERARANESSTR